MKQSFGWRILVIGILLAVLVNAVPVGTVRAALISDQVFTLQIHLPQGAIIHWLRLYFYDSNPTDNSYAWITVYDGAGNVTDLVTVNSTGAAGYGESLSPQIDHIVDNSTYTYVLNWRPVALDGRMRLMGMRVAYIPLGESFYSYIHVAGCTFTPRSSTIEWRDPLGGGVDATSWDHFLPFLRK